MVDPSTAALVSAAVGLALAALGSFPAVEGIYSRFTKGRKVRDGETHRLYEDKDGAATEESERAFSDRIQKIIIFVGCITGFLLSVALAVLATFRPDLSLFPMQWVVFIFWILLLLQAVALLLEPEPTKRFTLGIYGLISTILGAAVICVANLFLRAQISDVNAHLVHIILSASQIVSAVVVALTYATLPRRPDVFRNGKVVDRQHTVSLIGRYAFAWPESILQYARSHQHLEVSDLNELDYDTRAETLQRNFHSLKPRRKLWHSLIIAHAPAFILQWILTALVGVTQFAPQFALLKILRALEARIHGRANDFESWIWVICLGAAMIVSSWIEAWLFWHCFARLGIPVYEQLSAVIFMKAMRRKDVKGSQKAKTASDVTGTTLVNGGSGPKGEDTALGDGDDDDDTQKTKQSTINLVGVDSKRISELATFNYIFPYIAIKLCVAFIFLVSLIGWRALLSGLAVSAVITPVNIYASQKYSNKQTKLMKTRDQKMAVVTEALQGIRQIKFSALESQWHEKIRAIREIELSTQWTVFMYQTTLISIWILGPVMLSAVSLAVYAVLTGGLSASVAFTAISIFGAIEMTLAILPEMITDTLDAWVSVNRIEKYLNSAETVQYTLPGETVSYENATIAWPADDDEEGRYILRNLTFSFPNKELSIVTGKTGCGKSLLLSSILGECDLLSGVVRVPTAPALEDRHDDKANRSNWIIDSAVAYVAQIPWIENATIRDNILFGLPMDNQRYREVLSACALEKDLEILPEGELTDIGANGINLSGGQRWRVTLARALYSRAGILVLDDIFSAVDAHVGRHLYDKALTGELGKGRTRILVTHHVALCLPRTKYMVVLGDGAVEHEGLVEDLRRSGSLASILQQEQKVLEREHNPDEALEIDDGGSLQQMLSVVSTTSRRRSTASRHVEEAVEQDKKLKTQKFTQDETRETGAIKYAIYKEYFKTSGGFWFWMVILFFCSAYIGLVLGRSWWISLWTRSYNTESLLTLVHSPNLAILQRPMASLRTEIQENRDLWYYLGIYLGLSVATCMMAAIKCFLVFVGSIRASRTLFERLTFAVLRAPLRWLDTMPVGRVLNRFTADFNMIDSRIADDIGFLLHEGLQVGGIVIAGLFVSPLMLISATILLIICMYYALHYLAGAREVKRLESNAKSPIFEAFRAGLIGVGTIRGFGKAQTFVERMYDRIDTHARAYWHLWVFNRWVGFRLNIVGALFATIIAALIVSIRTMDASLAGFALSFALQYTSALVWALRQYANVELDMNATERVVEYSNIETEDQSGAAAPAAWPTEGRLEVTNLVVGYAPDLPPVLKGMSFNIEKNQRIGVVGRTGAGESSLTLALFRFLEAREGAIFIDGIDISKIKLHDLRSRLAIIPQDPVLFSGTVRSNLDAFDEHNDEELLDALERVHLIRRPGSGSGSGTVTPGSSPAVTTPTTSPSLGGSAPTMIPSSSSPSTSPTPSITLDTRTSEGGLNLSQGQRQLLCLARAIVSRPKIMVLDEATSAVDIATDALIQRSIREEFGDSTLIVIAHRLSTIADFDRILVMKDGAVAEFGEPRGLFLREEGEFRKMVSESGERMELERIILEKVQRGDGDSVDHEPPGRASLS